MCGLLVSCIDLKSSRRRLVKLFETATLPSKRMERQTTPSIAGQTSLHKSLSPQKEKSQIAIKTTVPQSLTTNTNVSVAERLVKNEKVALKCASSAFLRRSCTGWRQRPLARWFHPHIWLVHLNLSGRWQHDPPKEGRVLWQVTIVRLTQTRDFCFYDERHI